VKNSPLCENGLRRYLNGVIVLCGLLEEPPICFVFKVFRTPVVVGKKSHRKYTLSPISFSLLIRFFVLLHQSSWFVSYPNLTTLSITSCQHPLDPGIGRLLSRDYYGGRESIHRASILLCESIFQAI